MSAACCPREEELLDALGRGFVGAELDRHVASCAACGELRQVAGALLDERAVAMLEAPVPSAGTMWWRMRARLHQEAVVRARRSLLIGQGLTVAVAIALVISFFGADLALSVRQTVAMLRLSTPLLLIAATWLLVAPIAGWVAIRQK